jgi:cell division protein FtsW
MNLSVLQDAISSFGTNSGSPLFQVLSVVLRIVLPVLCIWLVARCAKSLLRGRIEKETWGRLTLPNGDYGEFHHWENTVGRSRRSDVVLNSPTVSRSHAAFLRDEKGNWSVYALTKNELTVNGQDVYYQESAPLYDGDEISMGGVKVTFSAITAAEELAQAKRRTKPGKAVSPGFSLILLTLIQAVLCTELLMSYAAESGVKIVTSFAILCLIMWMIYTFYRIMRRTGFEIETLAFFLTTLCMTVTANKRADDLYKQLICMGMGLFFFFTLSFVLRNLTQSKKLRWPVAVFAVCMLAFNLVLGQKLFGAKNWVKLGPISFQPSEIVKLAFVLVGSTTLDRMFSRRNLVFTLLFSAFCVGCLGLMSDFGTALIFFATFLAIAFLRSGDLPSVAFMGSAAVFGGFIIVKFKPYIARRFSIFLHAWSDTADLGYQQTRTMSAIASGGMFGHGVGNGWLKNIAAANTDLVFGVLGDEMGLLVALCAVAVIIILAIFAVKSAANARSTFYVIAACSTAMLFVVQTMLNVFGSVDLLPLTGVTFPFVSMGGSSMICCWGLLAYIKAADTRQNAGLAVRLPSKRAVRAEQRRQKKAAYYDDDDYYDDAPAEPTRVTSRRSAASDATRRVGQPPTDDEITRLIHHTVNSHADEDFDLDLDDDDIGSDADNWQDYFNWEDDDK